MAPRLLRIATAGSVDDGKSTLIGRLLHDSRSLLSDQLAQVELASTRRHGAGGAVDLALLTDGLRAEREQGITIDVAYRYFATARRSFIIADTPGHVSYTRNMVTGASTADLAVVLVDVRHGIVEQSRRHAAISALLGIDHVVLAVNKLDLVDFREADFRAVVAEFEALAQRLGIGHVQAIPMSALDGDNVVEPSMRMPWYAGPTLLDHLETVDVDDARTRAFDAPARVPVQWVVRPGADSDHADYRGFAGQVERGVLRPGDPVVVLPAGTRSTVAALDTFDGALDAAGPGTPVTVLLADDVDVARGDVIAADDRLPHVTRDLEATLCWMHEVPLRPGGRYAFRHAAQLGRLEVLDVEHRVDVATLDLDTAASSLALNELGRVRLRASTPVVWDPYAVDRALGSLVLIDEATNATVAAGMLVDWTGTDDAVVAAGADAHAAPTAAERTALLGLRGATIWLRDPGRSYAQPLAALLVRALVERGVPATLLAPSDPVVTMTGSPEDLARVTVRLAEAARLLAAAGIVAVTVADGAVGSGDLAVGRRVHDTAGVPFLTIVEGAVEAGAHADLELGEGTPDERLVRVLDLMRTRELLDVGKL